MSNRCNKGCTSNCGNCTQTLNESNKTVVIPVSGQSAYEAYKEYHPETTLTEKEYVEAPLKFNFTYTVDEL